MRAILAFLIGLLISLSPGSVVAQSSVPPLLKFTGAAPGAAGRVVLTFALYSEPSGGEPLWSETQVVTADANGRYTVLLGATQERGLPHELFVAGAPRWVGVRPDGQAELPRVLLTSVPYALKAVDAETIGGVPLSALVLAGETTGVGPDGLTYVNPKTLGAALGGAFVPTATAGTPNYLGKFTSATELGNSALYEASGGIGLGTTAPAANLHVVGTMAPAAFFEVVGALGALPAVYRAARGTPSAPAALQTDDIIGGLAVRGHDGTAFSQGQGQVMFRAAQNWTPAAHGTYLSLTTTPLGGLDWVERMRINPAGNVGIGTATPAQKLSVAGVVESTTGGFKFPDGTTQTTASSGGTSYSAGAGLSLASNVFSVNFGGTGSATTAARSDHGHTGYVYTAGTGLTLAANVFSVNFAGAGSATAAARSDHDHAGYATLGANTFTATQTISSGNLVLPASTASGGLVKIGNAVFLHGAGNNSNLFVGPLAGGGFASVGAHNAGAGESALYSNTSGTYNAAFGSAALTVNTTGSYNSALGAQSLSANVGGTGNSAFGYRALWSNTAGANNTAVGASCLLMNTASGNSGFGTDALGMNATGASNSAFGYRALWLNQAGNNNTATGQHALVNNTASGNSAFGATALMGNTTGDGNSAFGYRALVANTTGLSNTAVGDDALASATSAMLNTAVGIHALFANIASENTAIGASALTSNTSGGSNTAAGLGALIDVTTGSYNVGVGRLAGEGFSTGSSNTFVGYSAGPTTEVTNATAIGANAKVSQSSSLVLGDANVSVGIGTTAPNTRLQVVGNVRVGTSGTNGCVQRFDGTAIAGTCASDARLKTDIRPVGRVLDKIAQLRPVRYRWRAAEFPARHFGDGVNLGLIAQDVEQVFPEMVSTDEEGYKVVSASELPYLTIAAMKELKAENDRLKNQLDEITRRLSELERSRTGARTPQTP